MLKRLRNLRRTFCGSRKAAFQDFGADGQAFVEAQSKRPDILPEDLEFLRERLGAQFEVGGQTDASLPARRGAKTLVGVAVQGVTPNITELTSVKIAYGRGLTSTDDYFRRNVCVIGQDVVDELFNGANPLGEEIRLGQLPYEVVGVAQPRGLGFWKFARRFCADPARNFYQNFRHTLAFISDSGETL